METQEQEKTETEPEFDEETAMAKWQAHAILQPGIAGLAAQMEICRHLAAAPEPDGKAALLAPRISVY